MKDFAGKIAVVTGGGTGMGRALVLQLAAAGCHVATCDVVGENLAATRAMAAESSSTDVRVTAHRADVADEEALVRFRDELLEQHDTDHIHLLFNNAGIGGGGSMFTATRESWERTFDICWGGVYLGTRVFLPLLAAADEGHIVNTSSVNGFWASLGPDRPHTAYSAAKFAVKGFTEALITDLRINAPHVKASVVMPGHIGTSIVENSMRLGGMNLDEMPEEERRLAEELARFFRENAPLTPADAAGIILQGVRDERWRILVGDDAHALDAAVRANPEAAYDGLSLGELTN